MAVSKAGDVNSRRGSLKHAIVHDKLTLGAATYLVIIVVICILAPLISPETYSGFNTTQGGLHPHIGWRYLLGTDVFGHSMVAYLILGARTTVGVGALSTAIALILGGLVGVVAGVAGGWVDRILMTVVDVVLTIPFLVLVFVLVAYAGGSDPWSIAILLGLIGTFGAAQTIRHICAKEMRGEALVAARATGASRTAAARRHVLPALAVPLVYSGTMLLCALMSAEATMDFFGFGVRPSTVSWGTALALAPAYITGGFWWWYLLPGLALVATLFSIAIVGNALIQAVEKSQTLTANDSRPTSTVLLPTKASGTSIVAD